MRHGNKKLYIYIFLVIIIVMDSKQLYRNAIEYFKFIIQKKKKTCYVKKRPISIYVKINFITGFVEMIV